MPEPDDHEPTKPERTDEPDPDPGHDPDHGAVTGEGDHQAASTSPSSSTVEDPEDEEPSTALDQAETSEASDERDPEAPDEEDLADEPTPAFSPPADAHASTEQPDTSRRAVLLVGVVLVVLLGALAAVTFLGGSTEPVYTVFGEETTRDELAERLEGVVDQQTIEAMRDIENASAEERSVLSRVISDFITQDAMTAAAAEEGIEITDAQVDEQVDEIIETGFEGEQSQFEEALEESGQSLEQVRVQFRTALYAEAIVGEPAEVTDEDLQQFYDANFTAPLVSHLLVQTEEGAEAALARIDDGESFADVARDVSLDEQSAIQGGRLGPLEPGGFVEPFEEAAMALEFGEVSDPVQTDFGWHVITTEPPPELDAVEDELRAQIEQNRVNGLFLELAARLDEEAMITVDEAFGSWQGLNGGGLVPAGLEVDPPQPVPPVDPAPADDLPDVDPSE
ncbi:peptidylprolyl isomerase [Euzebya tangerina]|uniref:peptidylprolyl isomerase n=1 Tax=Euzebya tangerina TaxID=591198 RepID=UPI0013C2DC2B|nr:peptidylprolyl isomerase [Euzebya tangerina]